MDPEGSGAQRCDGGEGIRGGAGFFDEREEARGTPQDRQGNRGVAEAACEGGGAQGRDSGGFRGILRSKAGGGLWILRETASNRFTYAIA
jgi:hypothetical protein